MNNYIEKTDKNGKWRIYKGHSELVEPSQGYLNNNKLTQEEINKKIISEIESEQKFLLRVIEEMAEFLETTSEFKLHDLQKERINRIKEKRKQLK